MKQFDHFDDEKPKSLRIGAKYSNTTTSLSCDFLGVQKLYYKDSNFSISKSFTTQDYSYLPSSKANVNGKSIDKELPMPSRGIAQFRVILKVHPEVLTNLRFLDNRSILWCPTGKFVAVWICVEFME